MSRKREEFSMKTKLEAMARYLRCPGLVERRRECGKPFGALSAVAFDHIAAENATHDNSPENCRPLCAECHDLKTNGTKATSAGSDKHMAAKTKRLRGETKTGPKAKIRSQNTLTKKYRDEVKARYATAEIRK